ncbi:MULTISPECIES: hypothetical protein [unclassified Serratia (in: enterobacteria)]|uniref:hypothetical protein n=1 Tax=unclassified Serratia (in: enterobacteria) TaxID=2647522 RepID=UPI0030765681
MTLEEPDNRNACALLATLASHFYHCGVSRQEAGYDCDVVLLPLAPLITHLKGMVKNTPTPLTNRLLKTCRHWDTLNTNHLRLTLPRRQQNFGIEQHIWGHESAGHPPILRHRARKLTGDSCDFCGYTCKDNPLIFRDSNPENHADANLGVACPVCACSRHLNRLGANDGVMVYLPELAPADLSHLLRATLVAKQHGDERQKQGATTLLRWLAEHRKEVEAFWGTSHPGELGQALMQATDRQREDLQQRLRHIALIPNPDLISGHLSTDTNATTSWSSLFNQYRSQH